MERCTVCEINRLNLWLAMLVAVFLLAIPFVVKADEVAVGDYRVGQFNVCEDPDTATKAALILADEGEAKADAFILAPETPCGVTVPLGPWQVGNIVFAAHAKDGKWVKVVRFHAAMADKTVYWITTVDIKKAALPKGKAV